MTVPADITYSHTIRCVGPSQSGKSSVARCLSGSTWPVDVTTPAIVPIAPNYRAYNYDWYHQYICCNYLGHSFSRLLQLPHTSKTKNSNNTGNSHLNVSFSIDDPYNESQIRTKFQTVIANNYNHTRTHGGSPTSYWHIRARRSTYHMNCTNYNYNDIGYLNHQLRHKLENYKPDKNNDFQKFDTVNSCLIIIDAKKIINSYLRYQIEFDNAWLFIQDYLNDIFKRGWCDNYITCGSDSIANYAYYGVSDVMSILHSKIDSITREMTVILCLNKCDELQSESEFESKQYDSDREEMCEEYDELKILFNDKISEWKKDKICKYSGNNSQEWVDCASKINIETMIISAKSGYNLDNLLDKLGKIEDTKKTICENLIGAHLNRHNNEKRVVLWNYFCCGVMLLGLIVYFFEYLHL